MRKQRKYRNLGYILDNVVPCCGFCNFAKHKSSEEEFMGYLKRVAKFYKDDI